MPGRRSSAISAAAAFSITPPTATPSMSRRGLKTPTNSWARASASALCSPTKSRAFCGRPIGDLMLRGKTEALRAFEPLPLEQYETPATKAYLDAFAKLEAGDPGAIAAFASHVGIAAAGSAGELPPQAAIEWRNGHPDCDGIAATSPRGRISRTKRHVWHQRQLP